MIFIINLINENYKLIFLISFLFFIIIFFLFLKRLFILSGKVFFFKIKKELRKISKKILSNKKIKLFYKRNPKIILFFINRFNKNNFFGLPFTILFILFLYLLTEYIGITNSVLNGTLITQIDIRLSDFFYYFKDIRLIKLFLFFSYFGELKVVLLISFILGVILFLKGKIYHIIGLVFSVGISSFIVLLSKTIIQRERPEFAVYERFGYSFPSFHATISVALYGFIVWLFLLKIKKWKKRINLIFIGIFISFLIGFSRLYLNVSYLSDVISGWFLGFLGLILGITFIGLLKHKYNFKKIKYFKKKLNFIIISLLFICNFYIGLNYNNYYNSINFIEPKDNIILKINGINELFIRYPYLRFTETITGRKTEPINFIFLTKDSNDIKQLFKNSGWFDADKLGRTSIKNMTKALLDHKKYNTAPITPLYWNKQIQDYAFQKLTKQYTIKLRHHIRIWKTKYKIRDYLVLVGCGIYDDGLKWGITHKIDPNIDKEREYIFNSIKNNTLIKEINKIQLTKKIKGTNFSGDKFFTDGKAYLVKLK